MLKRHRRAPLICFVIAACAPSWAYAQCPRVPLQLASQQATLIIAGTPTKIEPLQIDPEIQGLVITFAVDTVWKGAARQTTLLYEWWTTEGLHPTLGTRYLMFAIPLRTVGPRTQEPPTELQTSGCADKSFEYAEKLGWIRELGPGRPPAQ